MDISIEETERLCKSLASKIKNNAKIKSICPILRGGMLSAYILSKLTNKPLISQDKANLESTLFVDDVCDSGQTLKKIGAKYSFVLFRSVDCPIKPTYFCKQLTSRVWLDFAWEKKGESDVKDLVVRMFQVIGENASRDGLIDTPKRMENALLELTQGYRTECPKITTFKNEAKEQDVVFDEGKYYSLCEHHVLPFFGNYVFAYIPKKDGRILGISKVARVVKWCSQKLQIQERLGKEIVEKLNEAVQADGMAIMLRGKHLCKTMRGACNDGEMTTFYAVGSMNDDFWRKELLSLIK